MKQKKIKQIKKIKHFQGAAMPPIFQQSTVFFDSLEALEQTSNDYGRKGTETNRNLEDQLAAVENANKAMLTQSGASAIYLSLLASLQSGDHLIVIDTVYGPTKNFCNQQLKKMAIDISYVPGDIGSSIQSLIKNNTKVIFLESPSSIFYQIQEIETIVKIAREKNIITIIDNTYGTCGLFKPLDYGIDISLISASKYVSGHSDLVMGAVFANDPVLIKKLDRTSRIFGYHTSPFDCYLAYRGLETAKLRLKQSAKSAKKIAQFLSKRDEVETVLYPSLKGFNQKKQFQKYFKSANGLITFALKQQYSLMQLRKLVNSLACFGIGYSWGGCESVVMLYDGNFTRPQGYDSSQCFIRIGVGLEDSKVLIADIKNALNQL